MVNTRGGLARNSDPITSHQAAASIDAAKLEAQVYKVIFSHGRVGCISDDVKEAMGLDNNSITPRFKPLKNRGHIIDTGWGRPGRSGRQQTILIAADFLEDWKEDHKDEL